MVSPGGGGGRSCCTRHPARSSCSTARWRPRHVPGPRERDADELELRVATLAPLLPLRGMRPRHDGRNGRARQLVRELDVSPAPPLLRTLALNALTRADFAAATRLGELLREAGGTGG